MPGRERVRSMLEAGLSYEQIADQLRITPGLAYLVATGVPADGSDAPSAQAPRRPRLLGTSQRLSNPEPAGNPSSSELVAAWIKRRVAADPQMQQAAAARAAAADAQPDQQKES